MLDFWLLALPGYCKTPAKINWPSSSFVVSCHSSWISSLDFSPRLIARNTPSSWSWRWRLRCSLVFAFKSLGFIGFWEFAKTAISVIRSTFSLLDFPIEIIFAITGKSWSKSALPIIDVVWAPFTIVKSFSVSWGPSKL